MQVTSDKTKRGDVYKSFQDEADELPIQPNIDDMLQTRAVGEIATTTATQADNYIHSNTVAPERCTQTNGNKGHTMQLICVSL